MQIAGKLKEGLWIIAGLAMTAGWFGCTTQKTITTIRTDQGAGVKTLYIPEAKLSPVEVEQIKDLAKEWGMEKVADITVNYKVANENHGIMVKGKERREGRDIFYDFIRVERRGRSDRKPSPQAKQIGPFWAEETDCYTTLLHEYELAGSLVRIAIDEDVEPEFADEVIPRILAREVQFEEAYQRFAMEQLLRSQKPSRIHKSDGDSGAGYQLDFSDRRDAFLIFQVKEGEIVVSSVGSRNN